MRRIIRARWFYRQFAIFRSRVRVCACVHTRVKSHRHDRLIANVRTSGDELISGGSIREYAAH